MGTVSWKAPARDKAIVGVGPGALAAVAVFLALSWNDGHHWDEFFYLYSVFAHSPAELVRFELRTELFPVGFFSGKVGHVVLLDLLTSLVGGGERSVYAIQALYALLLVGFFGAAYGLLRDLLGERRARDSTLVLVLSPLALYLSFKLLSEVPSVLFTTLGSWAFVRSFRRESRRYTGTGLALATIALAVGALCRVTAIVSFAALGLALLIAGDERFERRRLLFRLLTVGIAAVILQTVGLALAGGSPLRFGQLYSAVADHPPLQRAYALALFLQTFVLVLPFAWSARSETGPRLASIWFGASALSFLAGHEPRYYAPALIPFAVLAAAGLRGAAGFLFPARFRYGWVGLLAALALANRVLLIPLMPYEVVQARLLELFRTLHARAPGATYLIPWIADYSLLRFSFPGARIALCLSGTPGSRHSQSGPEGPLTQPDQWWAGADDYVGTRSALVQRPRPWYYIGWTYNPSALRLQQLLGRVGLDHLLRKGPRLRDHLAESWIWYDRSLMLSPRGRLAQYHVYELSPQLHVSGRSSSPSALTCRGC